jgi:hypothetical protein
MANTRILLPRLLPCRSSPLLQVTTLGKQKDHTTSFTTSFTTRFTTSFTKDPLLQVTTLGKQKEIQSVLSSMRRDIDELIAGT